MVGRLARRPGTGMLARLRSVMTPAAYHGWGQKPPFFEGWYFKLVSADRRQVYTVIPGIYQAAEASQSHAFVQVMDGNSGQSSYHVYPAGEFWAAEGQLDFRVGPNHFRADGIRLDIDQDETRIQGEVAHAGLTPWPVSLVSPGMMGWYAWAPGMECYHGVVSLDHALSGQLCVQGVSVDFSGGRGYIEKDWGRSFPQAWIWTQSNHFAQPGTCLTASVAVIPWRGHAFNGLIAGLWHAGRLYRFATYTGARVEALEIGADAVDWVMSDRRYRLELRATRAQGGILRAPTQAQMDRRIPETLNASLEVRLAEHGRGRQRILFEDVGARAGLEVVGEVERLKA